MLWSNELGECCPMNLVKSGESTVAQKDERVLVLLCTYNEAENVPKMIEQLHAAIHSADVLVVDDNSPDGTGRWVQEQMATTKKLHLLSRSGKLGLGSATRQGMQWAIEQDYDYLINLDADLSHRPSDVPRLLAECKNKCDVAVASRYLPGGGFAKIAFHRRMMSWMLNRYANWLLRLPLTDCSGSFRCYRVQALRNVELTSLSCNGYGFLEEILVALHRDGCRFGEVPIWFDARNMGHSKLTFADALGAIQVIHRLARARRRA